MIRGIVEEFGQHQEKPPRQRPDAPRNARSHRAQGHRIGRVWSGGTGRKPRLQSLAVKGGAASPAWATWLGLGVSAGRSAQSKRRPAAGSLRSSGRRSGSGGAAAPGRLAEQHLARPIGTQRHACGILLLDQPVGEQQGAGREGRPRGSRPCHRTRRHRRRRSGGGLKCRPHATIDLISRRPQLPRSTP